MAVHIDGDQKEHNSNTLLSCVACSSFAFVFLCVLETFQNRVTWFDVHHVSSESNKHNDSVVCIVLLQYHAHDSTLNENAQPSFVRRVHEGLQFWNEHPTETYLVNAWKNLYRLTIRIALILPESDTTLIFVSHISAHMRYNLLSGSQIFWCYECQ